MNIFKPKTSKEWLQRQLSLRVLFMLALITTAFFFEIRFFWIEQTLGAYLITTNSRRPMSGKIWESGLKTLSARNSLGRMVSNQLTSQYNIQDAFNFNDVYNRLPLNQNVMASSDHFRRLYTSLPLEYARQIMSPINLLKIIREDQWQRVLYKKNKSGMEVLFLDGRNQTLNKLNIPILLLRNRIIDTEGEKKRLDEIPEFKQILFVDQFFEILEKLPQNTQDNLFVDPKSILPLSGYMKRIGISDKAKSGICEIGIEVQPENIDSDESRVFVIRKKGFERALKQFRAELSKNNSVNSGSSENEPEFDDDEDNALDDIFNSDQEVTP